MSTRWADLDAYGHVNNAAMLTLLEEARIGAFWASDEPHPGGPSPAESHRAALLESGPQAATLTLIARQEVEYLLPIEYTRTPIVVRLWLSHIGGASIDVSYEVLVRGVLHAVALSTIVLVDATSGRPRRISPQEREAWSRHVGPAVEFRHRR